MSTHGSASTTTQEKDDHLVDTDVDEQLSDDQLSADEKDYTLQEELNCCKTTYVDIVTTDERIYFSVLHLNKAAQRSFQRQILFLSNESVKNALGHKYDHVCWFMSKLPGLPPYFEEIMKICEPFITSRTAWPIPPSSVLESDEQYTLFRWVFAAVSHFCEHWHILETAHFNHAEGWYDVNVWSVLIDHLLLKSFSVTCDRKELSAGIPELNYKHDGIIRGHDDRAIVGLIEVKPAPGRKLESHKDDDATDFVQDDLTKVAYALAKVLMQKKHPKLLLTGIICVGFEMTVIRGQWFGNVCLFKQIKRKISLQTLPSLLGLCWQLRLGFEQAIELSVERTFLSPDEDF